MADLGEGGISLFILSKIVAEQELFHIPKENNSAGTSTGIFSEHLPQYVSGLLQKPGR